MLAWQPEQVDDKAAYTFSLIAGSQWNVSEAKMMAQACRGSQSSLGPSQSVLNGLHQCVIAITRSSQGPRQDELYFMALQQIFFSFFSPPTWMHFFPPLYDVAWSECGIVFAFELPHKQFVCYFSLRGHFLFISEWSGWLRKRVYVYIFMLRRQYFRRILYGWNTRTRPQFASCIIAFQNMLLVVNLIGKMIHINMQQFSLYPLYTVGPIIHTMLIITSYLPLLLSASHITAAMSFPWLHVQHNTPFYVLTVYYKPCVINLIDKTDLITVLQPQLHHIYTRSV